MIFPGFLLSPPNLSSAPTVPAARINRSDEGEGGGRAPERQETAWFATTPAPLYLGTEMLAPTHCLSLLQMFRLQQLLVRPLCYGTSGK